MFKSIYRLGHPEYNLLLLFKVMYVASKYLLNFLKTELLAETRAVNPSAEFYGAQTERDVTKDPPREGSKDSCSQA